METIAFISNIATLIAVAIIGVILKQHLPSYLKEKGKNLATKEDIAEITDKVERVKTQYASDIEKLKSDLQNQTQLVERKREVYDNLGKSLGIFVSGRPSTEDQKKNFLEAYSQTWLWAPDPVIKSLNALTDSLLVPLAQSPTAQATRKSAFGRCVLEMRRDAGFSNTELREDEFRYVSFMPTDL